MYRFERFIPTRVHPPKKLFVLKMFSCLCKIWKSWKYFSPYRFPHFTVPLSVVYAYIGCSIHYAKWTERTSILLICTIFTILIREINQVKTTNQLNANIPVNHVSDRNSVCDVNKEINIEKYLAPHFY